MSTRRMPNGAPKLPISVGIILLEHFAENPWTPLSKDSFKLQGDGMKPPRVEIVSMCGGVALAVAAQHARQDGVITYPKDEDHAVELAEKYAGIPESFTRTIFRRNDAAPKKSRADVLFKLFCNAMLGSGYAA